MQKFLVLLYCFTTSALLFAQPGGEKAAFTGAVVDETGAPVPYASVAVYSLPDSALAGGAASDENGNFEVAMPAGNYYLLISFLSFEDQIVGPFTLGKENIAVPKITLSAGSVMTGEVEIVDEKPAMELKLDKRVFNIDKDMDNQGANAAEVLDNIPSISVDVEGNVSLRGSENVRILIDGKPSGLTGISGSDALRMLQGDLVERVEVITNPSARYDAEGEVGIINIILKKEKREGINGSFEARAGYPANHGLSFNLNARRKKMNIFTSYGLGYRRTPGTGNSYQLFTYPDTTFSYEIDRLHTRGGLSHNFRLGSEFTLSPKSSLTLSGMYRTSKGDNISEVQYTDFNAFGESTQVVDRDETENDTDASKEFNLNYRKTFKKKDALFTFDVRWTESEEEEYALITESSSNPDYVPMNQQSTNDEYDQRWTIQTDYVYPLGKDGKFEAGAKAQLRTLDITYSLSDQTDDGLWVVNDAFDNRMIYDEYIYAAYLMAGNKKGKFSYQGGLRAEYSDIQTQLVRDNFVNPRNYFNLFPSAHLSYELKKENFVQLSYSRRIGRPHHWWLMPFYGFSDVRAIATGNPNINPDFTDSYELGYLKQFKKGSILSSIYYRHTTDLMTRVVLSDSTGTTRRFPINLGTEDAFGLEFSGSYELTKSWNVTGNLNFFRSIQEGNYEGVDYDADTYGWTGRFTSKWKIKRKFSAQASLRYRSRRATTQGESLPIYVVNAGAAMDVLKGNGTLTFNVRDLFNMRKRRSITYGDNFYSNSEFQWQARQFTLTFNYRLNQKKRMGGGRGDYDGGGDMDM